MWNYFLVLNNIWFSNFKSWLLNKNLLSSPCLCTALSSFLNLFKMGFQLYPQPSSSSFSWNFKMNCTYIMLHVSEIAEHINFKDLWKLWPLRHKMVLEHTGFVVALLHKKSTEYYSKNDSTHWQMRPKLPGCFAVMFRFDRRN